MRFYIVTGMSGAGKTVALKTLEDLGFYCVDNLPAGLLPQFAELCSCSGKDGYAVGMDIRSGIEEKELENIFSRLSQMGIGYKIIFLDASDSVLIKRFKETRRSHPLSKDGRLQDVIDKEREALSAIRSGADFIIDTSGLLSKDLRARIENVISGENAAKNMAITVMSFGFKYGIPEDADLVFDVRFLPNPYYVDELRPLTGMSKEVQDYVLSGADGREFLERLYGMTDFLIPRYVLEGKNQLVIAFGCTGGKHRSVTLCEAVYEHLKADGSFILQKFHRDAEK